MVKFLVILLIIVVILGILGIFYKLIYNRLQHLNIKINEADKIINDHLKKRYDYVVRTSHLIKKNIDIDIELFKEIESLKVKKASNVELDDKITEAYNTILKLHEDYPELDENRGFQDILSDFEESNEIIEASKSYYDKYATDLNGLLNKFPINIIGKIHHIAKKEYYNTLEINDNLLKNGENF